MNRMPIHPNPGSESPDFLTIWTNPQMNRRRFTGISPLNRGDLSDESRTPGDRLVDNAISGDPMAIRRCW